MTVKRSSVVLLCVQNHLCLVVCLIHLLACLTGQKTHVSICNKCSSASVVRNRCHHCRHCLPHYPRPLAASYSRSFSAPCCFLALRSTELIVCCVVQCTHTHVNLLSPKPKATCYIVCITEYKYHNITNIHTSSLIFAW